MAGGRNRVHSVDARQLGFLSLLNQDLIENNSSAEEYANTVTILILLLLYEYMY